MEFSRFSYNKVEGTDRTFDNVHSKALEFVNKCNDKISQLHMDENQTLEIDSLETALPVKRQRKKKRMADELIVMKEIP